MTSKISAFINGEHNTQERRSSPTTGIPGSLQQTPHYGKTQTKMETPTASSRETGFITPKPYLLLKMDDYDYVDEHLPGNICFILRLY
jgi:hypothetical protein